MRTLIQGKTEEPALWYHWQSLSGKPLWQSGRAWLHTHRNAFGAEWHWLSKRIGFSLDFDDTGDHAFLLGLCCWFFSLYLTIQRLPIVRKLPGVKWAGHHESGSREISVTLMDGGIYWRLWRHPHVGYCRDWRDRSFKPLDLILGREKYNEGERNHFDTFLELPEATYPLSIDIYPATWKRPRWPWGRTVMRADIECERGAPVPGKGDNSWDMEDDAIYGMTTQAGTVAEAKEKFRASVMRDRERYG